MVLSDCSLRNLPREIIIGTSAMILFAIIYFCLPGILFGFFGNTIGIMSIFLIPAIVLLHDISLHGKWVTLHKIYSTIVAAVGTHPQMTSLQGKFTKKISTETETQRKLYLVLALLFAYMIFSLQLESKTQNVQTTSTVQENIAPAETPSLKAIETSRDESSIELPTAPQSLGEYWIKDNNTDVYLWNPEPYGDERISWNGSYVQDGDYKFAEGSGTVTWYRDGQVIQVDEGSFEHSRHHGRFKHTLESGNVVYSNWEHGEEVIDTPAPCENTNSKGQYVGTYNSGMKAYIVPGTLKVSSDRNSCNVKILAEGDAGDIAYLDYRIWREGSTLNFSNSEGYSGVITSNMRVENKIWEIAQNQF